MADTLREYLVSLGFRVDEPTWKKYTAYMALAGKTTAELGSVAVETATAIELAVAKVARQYETLYYVSESTGKSIGAIQSSQFAFRQIGLSAEDATSALESMAETARMLPGIGGMFGGATRPEEVVEQLKNSGMMYVVAKKLAELRGVPGGVFQRLWFMSAEDKAREREAFEGHSRRLREAGVDADAAGHKFIDFTSVLNTLEDDLGILGTRIALDWVHPTSEGVRALDLAVQWMNRADVATRGWLDTLLSLGTTLGGGLLGTAIIGRLLGFPMAGTLAGGGRFLGKAGLWGLLLGSMEAMKTDIDHSLRSDLRRLFGIEETEEERAAPSPWEHGAPRRRGGVGGVPTGATAERLTTGVQMLTDAGYSREAAVGIMSGLYYESGRTLSPAAFNPAGGGRGARGIPQLRGERIDEFERWAGKGVEQSSFEDQMRYVIWAMDHGADLGARRAGELLRRPGARAGESARTFLDVFERPGPAGAAEVQDAASLAEELSRVMVADRGAAPHAPLVTDLSGLGAELSASLPPPVAGDVNNVTLHSKTDIHVEAGPTALGTALAVMDAQDRVSQSTTRALVGAIR